MPPSADDARTALLRTFRWTDGHADFAPLLADHLALTLITDGLIQPHSAAGITRVVALEARGFVWGALCADRLGAGLVLARKPGSIHPGAVVTVTSAPDWRGNQVELSIARALGPSDRVLLVDDWIETGSQARAATEAVESMGAELIGTSVLVDGTTPEVRAALNVHSIAFDTDLQS